MSISQSIENAYAALCDKDIMGSSHSSAMSKLVESGALETIVDGARNTQLEEARWLFGLLSDRLAAITSRTLSRS